MTLAIKNLGSNFNTGFIYLYHKFLYLVKSFALYENFALFKGVILSKRRSSSLKVRNKIILTILI